MYFACNVSNVSRKHSLKVRQAKIIRADVFFRGNERILYPVRFLRNVLYIELMKLKLYG
jgi:hypothetical protein